MLAFDSIAMLYREKTPAAGIIFWSEHFYSFVLIRREWEEK